MGDSVAISMADRDRGDPRNIPDVILDCNEQNMYSIAVKSGIISFNCARNQFGLPSMSTKTPDYL